MEIRCIRCEKKFVVSEEQLEQIKTIQLEEMKPVDLLDFFPLIAGRCTRKGFEDKKHAFVYTEEFNSTVRGVLTECDNSKKELKDAEAVMVGVDLQIKKLAAEKEMITKRLEEIRDLEYVNNQEYDNLYLVDIPNKKKKIEELTDKFEKMTGTRNTELWT